MELSYFAIAAQAASAIGAIRQAQAQSAMYEAQAAMSDLEGRRRALQFEQRANATLARLNQVNAATRARAFAGGTSGFEGSAALVQAVSSAQAGRDFAIDIQNASAAERGGALQASLYRDAASTALEGGFFDAASKLGAAYYQYRTIGKPPSGGS